VKKGFFSRFSRLSAAKPQFFVDGSCLAIFGRLARKNTSPHNQVRLGVFPGSG
jgi:hypothetical protein